jgi:hypothetical protein
MTPLDHERGVAKMRGARSARRGSKSILAAGRQPSAAGHAASAYEQRKWSKPHPVELLARDIATVQVRDFIRQVVRELLLEAGIILPPPPPKPKRHDPPLRLIKK